MFQALSDASRRRMVEQLTHGPASATELSRPFEMTLSAVMQHLAVLERAGLVGSEKIGRVRTYRLVTAPLREIEGWLHRQRTGWDNRLDLLEATLTAKSPPGPTEGEQP
ncbi:transcriptional regulator [Nakamurella silvestris]|nr:transcriptional regulator [Nakamurella silvestris]